MHGSVRGGKFNFAGDKWGDTFVGGLFFHPFLHRLFYNGILSVPGVFYNGMAIFLRKNNTFWVSLVSPAREKRPKSSPETVLFLVPFLLPAWKSRCEKHLFLVFFGVIFYNGNLWFLQRVLMEFTTKFVVNCIKTRCKFMYFFYCFGTLQNLAETLKHRWPPSQMHISPCKSRCKFHLFLLFFGGIFYNGNLWNLQRILMEFTTDLVSCPGKWSKNPVVKTSKNRTFLISRPFFFCPL